MKTTASSSGMSGHTTENYPLWKWHLYCCCACSLGILSASKCFQFNVRRRLQVGMTGKGMKGEGSQGLQIHHAGFQVCPCAYRWQGSWAMPSQAGSELWWKETVTGPDLSNLLQPVFGNGVRPMSRQHLSGILRRDHRSRDLRNAFPPPTSILQKPIPRARGSACARQLVRLSKLHQLWRGRGRTAAIRGILARLPSDVLRSVVTKMITAVILVWSLPPGIWAQIE